jgi:hypothetical protein
MYSNDEGNSSDEEDNNTEDFLFMAINEFSEDEKHEYPDEEGEVNIDLEGELIFSLSVLKKLRNKNESLKEQLRKSKGEHHEPNGETETIGLKIQLEEEKRIEEILENKLKEMEDIFHEREIDISCLRKELDNVVAQLNTNLRFEKRSTVL